MSSRFSTTLWLIIAIAGMGFVQWLTRSEQVRLPPGPERGDITVPQDALESDIDGWKQIKFTPAQNPEQLPDGQFWLSFTWQYQKDDLVAVVAFDQADWEGWHELTQCYQALGWKLRDRSILTDSKNDFEGTMVMALFQRIYPAESAALVFSEFNEHGDLLTAPGLSVIRPKVEHGTTVFEKAHNRFGFNSDVDATIRKLARRKKVLQVQVVLPSQRHLKAQELEALITLHERCTSSLRREWLRQMSIVRTPSHHSPVDSEQPR